MAVYLPWITFFIGIFTGWLLTWLMMIGSRRDLEELVGQLEEDVISREADLAACQERNQAKADEYKARIKTLKGDLKTSNSELESLKAQVDELQAAAVTEVEEAGADEPAEASQDSDLAGTWMVEFIYERPVIDNSPASIIFSEEEQLAGNASCNNYFGKYSVSGSNLTLDAAGKTNKMCIVAALMEQEARFMDALPAVSSYEILHGILTLKDESGETIFRAARQSG